MLAARSNPGNQPTMAIMGFQGIGKSSAMRPRKAPSQDRGPTGFDRPPDHRSEFPAGYSSAGCSPAEPASASPAIASVAPARSGVRQRRLKATAQFTLQVDGPLSHRRPLILPA